MDKSEIKEKVSKGAFHAIVTFELIGGPKEHLKKALNVVLQRVPEESKCVFLKTEVGEPEETVDGLFGAFIEAEMFIPDATALAWLCFNFSPASIDILAPESRNFSDKQMSDLFNDLLARIHEANTHQIEVNSMNKALQKNINAILRNAILIVIGSKELTSTEIGAPLGITGKDLELVLSALIKENKIVKNDTKYKRIGK